VYRLNVEVHLHGALERYVTDARRGVVWREVPTGARVIDVLASFDLPAERRVIVGVNGQAAGLDDTVPEGARIDLVPPISGGSLKGPSD
jgi:sulfur carrier protein ThiS